MILCQSYENREWEQSRSSLFPSQGFLENLTSFSVGYSGTIRGEAEGTGEITLVEERRGYTLSPSASSFADENLFIQVNCPIHVTVSPLHNVFYGLGFIRPLFACYGFGWYALHPILFSKALECLTFVDEPVTWCVACSEVFKQQLLENIPFTFVYDSVRIQVSYAE